MSQKDEAALSALTANWRERVLALTMLFSITGYAVFSFLGGEAVLFGFAEVGFKGVASAFSWVFLAQFFRFIRWHALLKLQDISLSYRKSLRIFCSGFALSTVATQGKGAMRGALLHKAGVPYRKSAGVLFAERVSTGASLVLIFMVAVSQMNFSPWVGVSCGFIAILFITILQMPSWLKKISSLAEPTRFLAHLFLGFRHLFKPVALFPSIFLGLLALALEGIAFHQIILLLGADLDPFLMIKLYGLARLASALTFLPAGLGSFELMMWQLLVIQQVPDSWVLVAIITFRFVSLWFWVLIGMMVSWKVSQ